MVCTGSCECDRKPFQSRLEYTSDIRPQSRPDISRSKSNQEMKFGQLLEYNIRNIFLEIPCSKCVGKTCPRAIFKKIKIEHICELTVSSFIDFVFFVCPSRRPPKHIETKFLTTCLYLTQSFLKKQQKVWN